MNFFFTMDGKVRVDAVMMRFDVMLSLELIVSNSISI